MRTIINIAFAILFTMALSGQTSDNQYKMPLAEVLEEIRERYDIAIRDPEGLVSDQWITYAEWRFRPDVEETLENVLASVDISFQKEGENKYKLKKFQYYRWPLEEAKEKAEYLAGLYDDVESWEARKMVLRQCMWKALKLEKGLPAWPDTEPIITNPRKMKGYRIENVALEVLPGVYTFGSVYQPVGQKGKSPIVLCPNGHWQDGRYRPNHQIRCAMLAKMGAVVVSYDLFVWGESMLQFPYEAHRRSLAMTMQVLNTFRFLDYLIGLEGTDKERIAIVGGSGAGSHSMLITALDGRISLSIPTVMLSCYMYGGCPCESGMPVHLCGDGTNNVEISSMAAPRPQLIISDGNDWTTHVPEIEFPLVQRVYAFYGKENLVENTHFADEGHDFGPSKRMAGYPFVAKYLQLDLNKVMDKKGNIDESDVTIEEKKAMYVLDNNPENLPKNAVRTFKELENVFEKHK